MLSFFICHTSTSVTFHVYKQLQHHEAFKERLSIIIVLTIMAFCFDSRYFSPPFSIDICNSCKQLFCLQMLSYDTFYTLVIFKYALGCFTCMKLLPTLEHCAD